MRGYFGYGSRPRTFKNITLGVYYPGGFSYGDDLRSDIVNRLARSGAASKICRERPPNPDAVEAVRVFLAGKGFTGELQLVWSVYAGCSCPCSPGYNMVMALPTVRETEEQRRFVGMADHLRSSYQKRNDRYEVFEDKDKITVKLPGKENKYYRPERIELSYVGPDARVFIPDPKNDALLGELAARANAGLA